MNIFFVDDVNNILIHVYLACSTWRETSRYLLIDYFLLYLVA